MDITKLFNTSKRYDKKTVGGIEIETCVKQKYYDPPEGSAYEATEDGSIECSDGLVSVEYITEDPFPIVDIMDGSTKIGKDTNEIMNNAYPCDTDEGFVTCGTHVHMSRIGVTKKKYPHFNVLMRYIWLTYYQPYCLARFYRFQNRYKNTYAASSSEKDIYDKYQMFNETHSRYIQPNEDWHFEFRGYGEMLSGWKEDKGAPKEYMRVLMSMWIFSLAYYDKFALGQYHNLIIRRENSPPNKKNDRKLLNILYEFIRKPVPGSVWSSDGIRVKVHHVHAGMVNYTIVLEENRKYLRNVWKKLGKAKTKGDRTTTRTWMLQLCKINHPMLMGLDEFKKTYDYNGKRDETYEDKVGAFLTFFDSTHLWYSVQRVVPPKIPSILRRGILWTDGIKAIRIVNVVDFYVDYVYEKAYNQAAYEPYQLYVKKTDKFLKTFEFAEYSKIEEGDWWFDSLSEVVVQIRSNYTLPENMVQFKRGSMKPRMLKDDFYKTYTYGGPVRDNDLWNFGKEGYEIVRVNDVGDVVTITSLDNSIYKGHGMSLLEFLKKGTKLNRPPVRKGDIWCNSDGDKLPISKVDGTYVHVDLHINNMVWEKDKFLERYTFYRSADTKDIADPEEGATWYDGTRFAKVEGQFGSYLINLNIDGQWVQMGFTKFLREFRPLMYGNGELILVGDRVKIVKDGDEDDGKTAIVETFYRGMISVELPRYQDEFEPHELEFLGRKESSLSGWWDDTDSDEEIIQKFNLKL
tara:strand:+ start:1054 stop:3282 length:2229 start_codon:yes stop_codon:yes gene_type:complete